MHITCDRCNLKVDSPGALVFSPPDANDRTLKLHLCIPCWMRVRSVIDPGRWEPEFPDRDGS